MKITADVAHSFQVLLMCIDCYHRVFNILAGKNNAGERAIKWVLLLLL